MRIHCAVVNLKKQGGKQSKSESTLSSVLCMHLHGTHLHVSHPYGHIHMPHTHIHRHKYVYCFALIGMLIGSIIFVFVRGRVRLLKISVAFNYVISTCYQL